MKYAESSGSTSVQTFHDEQGSMTIVRDYAADGSVAALRVYFDGELATEKEHTAVKALLESRGDQ